MKKEKGKKVHIHTFVREHTPQILLFLTLALFSFLFFVEFFILSYVSPILATIPFSWWWFFAVIAITVMILREGSSSFSIQYSHKSFFSACVFHALSVSLIVLFNIFFVAKSSFASFALVAFWYLELLFIITSLAIIVVLGDINFLSNIWKKISLAIILGTLLFTVILLIHSLWKYLSLIVAHIVFFVLRLLFTTAFYIPNSTYNGVYYDGVPTVGAGNFGGVILKTCSGVEGLSLFLILFSFLIILEWRNIREKWKIPVLYILGMLTMFLFNILRVFLLILAGIQVSPEFAAGGLHTNLGWIFFTFVFIFFEFLSYRWMVRR